MNETFELALMPFQLAFMQNAFLVTLMIALLYWAAPNVRGRGFRWVNPGGVLATLIWLAASAGFAVYAANFGSYNKTYGTLAGAVVFLVWLWLTNLAILLGLEFDAELSRERAIAEGRSPTEEPYVEPRDTRTWPPRLRALREARARTTGSQGTSGTSGAAGAAGSPGTSGTSAKE